MGVNANYEGFRNKQTLINLQKTLLLAEKDFVIEGHIRDIKAWQLDKPSISVNVHPSGHLAVPVFRDCFRG